MKFPDREREWVTEAPGHGRRAWQSEEEMRSWKATRCPEAGKSREREKTAGHLIRCFQCWIAMLNITIENNDLDITWTNMKGLLQICIALSFEKMCPNSYFSISWEDDKIGNANILNIKEPLKMAIVLFHGYVKVGRRWEDWEHFNIAMGKVHSLRRTCIF